MKEQIELRVSDTWVLSKIGSLGSDIGYGVRKIVVDITDPRLDVLRSVLNARQIDTGEKAYHSAFVIRRYSKAELDQSTVYRLIIKSVFEPAGEELGTLYDYSTICAYCGAGRIQKSNLILDLKNIPRKTDIAQTIANEIIISERLASLLTQRCFTGYELGVVEHYDSAYASAAMQKWKQLHIIKNVGWASKQTVFGIDPFDVDKTGEYRCPSKHVSGLNLISELFLERKNTEDLDIGITSDFIGYRQGLLVPFPLIVISKKIYEVLVKSEIKGYSVEIVHLTD